MVPDRPVHHVELGPLCIRNRVDGLEGEGPSRAFLSYHDLRRATASGYWAQSRRLSPGALRPVAEITLYQNPGRAEIVVGLSLAEANLLVTHAGGRLPTQKELDVILSRYADLHTALPPNVCLWTSSAYHLFDYSHRRYSLERRRWETDDQVKLPRMRAPAGANAMQSVLESRNGQVIRHAAPAEAYEVQPGQGETLRATALLVLPLPAPAATEAAS
jgi:hypothetical protein